MTARSWGHYLRIFHQILEPGRSSRVSESCGYGVPLFDYRGNRDSLDKWARSQGTAKLEEYRQAKNKQSIDGLPALDGM